MSSRNGTTAYLGLGANVGDREENLRRAIDRLRAIKDVTVVRVSKFYETAAVGGPANSPPFLNAAAELLCRLSPHELLTHLLDIEHSLGRIRRDKWEPRPIDLDILLFGDRVVSTDVLDVPHPLMHDRKFVLQPLAEIAPEAVHPMLQMSVRGMLDALNG